MVLGKLPVPGRSTIWITVGQGPTALAVGAGRGCLDIFTPIYPFSSLSPSVWETALYRLKYCLKGPLNPKQPTNQSFPRSETKSVVYGDSSSIFPKNILPLIWHKKHINRHIIIISEDCIGFIMICASIFTTSRTKMTLDPLLGI